MSGAGWAALAGFANALGSDIEARRAQEDKMKLYEQEQALMEKRETTLAQIRANLQDENAAKRSDRNEDRDTKKHDMTMDDVVGQFTDPETGSVYGRTKSGGVIPLNTTSGTYQDNKAAILQGQADAAPQLAADRAHRANAQPRGRAMPPAVAQGSPTQPGAPTMQQLMDAANAAVKAGKDPTAVEARLKQLMQQYGYNPQAPDGQ